MCNGTMVKDIHGHTPVTSVAGEIAQTHPHETNDCTTIDDRHPPDRGTI